MLQLFLTDADADPVSLGSTALILLRGAPLTDALVAIAGDEKTLQVGVSVIPFLGVLSPKSKATGLTLPGPATAFFSHEPLL